MVVWILWQRLLPPAPDLLLPAGRRFQAQGVLFQPECAQALLQQTTCEKPPSGERRCKHRLVWCLSMLLMLLHPSSYCAEPGKSKKRTPAARAVCCWCWLIDTL